MKYLRMTAMAIAATYALIPTLAAAGDEHVAPVTAYMNENVIAWVQDPIIIDAIKAQNAAHAGLGKADIDALDKKWRAEVQKGDQPLIASVMSNQVSAFLKEKQAGSKGAIAEVFVMDNKGLNVGQSEITSDYWQGDEAKFQKTFDVGPKTLFVDEVEKDESTQALQSQASMTIVDETGKAIGAVTVGVNLSAL
ncbi:hypothetical protein [Rhizobium sp.]|jgi:hypothetical protein|uniref:hypothetical protein n=1 Tax=Rhizobium sp. TaxID=391 RepID=UPI000E8429EA|nr:hypothetical protein [Rhizobium sp.]